MQTTSNFERTGQGTSQKTYKGILITRTWIPSNYGGTVINTATVKGHELSSPSWANLKKAINKILRRPSI
jgi:hypothetical protein